MLQITRLSDAGIVSEGFQVEEHPKDGGIGWTVLAHTYDELTQAIEHCYQPPHLPRIEAAFGCPFCREILRQEQEKVQRVEV